MRTPLLVASVSVLLLGTSASAGGDRGADETPAFRPYVLERAIGPKNVSFPWAVAVSPNGRWIASADGHSGRLSVVDVRTGVEGWLVKGPARSPKRVAFARDSRRLAGVTTEEVLVLALGESVSIQSVSLALQVLHGHPPTWGDLGRKVGRELVVGFLLGAACGATVGLIAFQRP